MRWEVHKFGGTSVGSADRMRGVMKIVGDRSRERRLGIVVSAMKGATDALLEISARASARDASYLAKLDELAAWHVREAGALLRDPSAQAALVGILERDVKDIRDVLRGVWLLGQSSDRSSEMLAGYGELWSAQFLEALLRENGHDVTWLDARQILEVIPSPHQVNVDWAMSSKRIAEWLEAHPQSMVVITGFIASTKGVATTLGRNGSDFSGAIFGSLLDADEISIWTDVDGVLSADPRRVPEAEVLEELSYQEVTELAYFGAKVVHPATMEPAIKKNIPVWIRNTFRPEFPGTKIHASPTSKRPVKGLSTIDDIALVSVEGTGMRGIPGVAERLFSALRSADISVILISQASSEQSICFAVRESEAEKAKAVIERDFASEILRGSIDRADIVCDCSILAAVGDNMAHQPGLAGRFFTALGRAGVSVRAIAQGSTERNISAVIPKADSTRALRAAHASFYLSRLQVAIGVVGAGLIGKAFLRQVHEQMDFLKSEREIDPRIAFVATSKKMAWVEGDDAWARWESELERSENPLDLDAIVTRFANDSSPHRVIIDASASDAVASKYVDWLERGIHVITPNKRANTGLQEYYDAIRLAATRSGRHFLYSTNVGAGLPVLPTLRHLRHTGDRVRQIQGIMSGTLSYLFNNFSGAEPFSVLLRRAIENGFTEPDPRDDLSGTDVARKLVILAREAGIRAELANVRVQSLVPEALRGVSVADFMARLSELDQPMADVLEAAAKEKAVPRYVGTLDDNGTLRVEIGFFGATHVFHGVSGSDNIVLFRTKRYDQQPLVIRGPGAGTDVTAAGVFADFLRLSSFLGARP